MSPVLFLGLALSRCDREPGPEGPSVAAPRFVEITDEVGLGGTNRELPAGSLQLPEIMGPGVALFDADGDGDLDLLVAGYPLPADRGTTEPHRLFRQEDDGRFVEVTESAGIGDPGFGQGLAVGDFDGDGDADVYLANYGADALYRNRGDGSFENVTAAAGLGDAGWSCAATFVDYDRDQDLDLFVVRYVRFDPQVRCARATSEPEYCTPQTFPSTTDLLYQNQGDGTFVDVSRQAGIVLPGAGLGVVACDLSGDGWVDLYVANDAQVNHLWVNQQDGRFEDQAYLRGVGVNRHGMPEASMGLTVGDVDGDGRLDLFMTHLAGENNTLFRQLEGASFRDSSAVSRMSALDLPYTGFGCAFLDHDHDGDLDLAVVNGRVRAGPVWPGARLPPFWQPYGEPNLLLENQGQGEFEDRSAAAGAFAAHVEVSRGLATGDLDNDGDLDLVVAQIGGGVRVFRNTNTAGHWLMLRLVTGRRDALGAEVEVVAGTRRLRRLCLAGFSYASSCDPRVHVGLGASDSFDRILVHWPDGQSEGFAGGRVDRFLTLVQGQGDSP